MKKLMSMILAILLSVFTVSSATDAYEYVEKLWEAQYAVPFSEPYAVKTDSSGNVYVTATIKSSWIGITLKYNTNGALIWNRTIGGRALAVDASDNVYVTGASQTAKYDVNGNEVWKVNIQGIALEVDPDENVFVVNNATTVMLDSGGAIKCTTDVGGSDVKVGNDGLVYVGKRNYVVEYDRMGAVTYSLDKNCNVLNTGVYNGPDDATISSVYFSDLLLDEDGNGYLVGSASNAYSDRITVKYDVQGNVLLEELYDYNNYYDSGYTLAFDDLGNVFSFGISNGGYGWFSIVTKYNDNGLEWRRSYCGFARNIITDSKGDVYVTTNKCSTNRMYKTKGNGAYAWYAPTDTWERSGRRTIDIDPDGNVYSLGWRYINNSYHLITVKFKQTIPNLPPVANAGDDQTVTYDSTLGGAFVTLDGSGSSDPDGDPLTYIWTWNGGNAEGVSPTITLPSGTTTITLAVDDGNGETATDTVDISVLYDFNGFLQPVSLLKPFKLGSTIPVKFQLKDVNGYYVSTAYAEISLVQLSGSEPTGDPIDGTSNVPDSGNVFRYDSTDNQYIYNLSTDILSIGTWRATVTLDDGESYTTDIAIK